MIYGLINYRDSLFIVLCRLPYIIYLGLLIAVGIIPLFFVYTIIERLSGSVFLASLAGMYVFIALLGRNIWSRARRLIPLLGHIIAFDKIDGQSGPWFSKMAATYHAFKDEKLVSSLNQAMVIYLCIKTIPLLFFASDSQPSQIDEITLSIVNSVLSLWMATAAAGFYRLNNISPAAMADKVPEPEK